MNWQISFIIRNDFNQMQIIICILKDFKIIKVKYVSKDNGKSFQMYILDMYVWAERDSIQYLKNDFNSCYIQGAHL